MLTRNPYTLAAEENCLKSGSPPKRAPGVSVAAFPDPLSPTQSTSSALKIPDPQPPVPSFVETEETPKKWKGTLLLLNQQPKDTSKWNISLID
jgi:hypothetical protein